MITLKQLENAGYQRYKNVFGYSEFLMQKCVTNLNGTKYCINFEAYAAHPTQLPGTMNFEAAVQYTDNNRSDDDPLRKPTVNVTHLDTRKFTLEEIEDFYEGMWAFLGEPYYDRADNF